jgi:hypothetical protein
VGITCEEYYDNPRPENEGKEQSFNHHLIASMHYKGDQIKASIHRVVHTCHWKCPFDEHRASETKVQAP